MTVTSYIRVIGCSISKEQAFALADRKELVENKDKEEDDDGLEFEFEMETRDGLKLDNGLKLYSLTHDQQKKEHEYVLGLFADETEDEKCKGINIKPIELDKLIKRRC
jgi:hypothetical protein